jgi:hypothetical protein
MQLERAVKEILLGASVQSVGAAYRQDLIDAFAFRAEEVRPETFAAETESFQRRLCRMLGERHAGNTRVGQALRDWVMLSDHYEAFDALLSAFEFPGKEALVQRGRKLFPGPLTAHWTAD